MKFSQSYFSKHRWWLIAAAMVGCLVVVARPAVAATATVGGANDTLAKAVSTLLANIVLFILQAVAQLTGLFIHVLVFISQYNSFINVAIVKTGWALVKDISNMFFIIALLVIAVGTILRLENYRYNRLLGRVIVMAFLVNFSMLIAGFFIQAGQVVMITFANAYKEAAFGNFASMFGLDKVLQFATSGQASGASIPIILISLIAGLAMMITALVVTVAICAVLVVRIIALWILIILSPLAYAMRILPNTEKYFGQWWSEFTKYVVVGPVLAFFLWLALAIHASSGSILDTKSLSFQQQADGYVQESGYVPGFATENLDFSVFTTFFVSIIFLTIGLKYAQQSGGAGGEWAGRIAQKGFAAGAAVTGLNAIRDRTIAPVQGWIANRQQAARARVADRTLTLEGAGARTRAAIGRTTLGGAVLSKAGTQRAEASAVQVERKQVQRRVSERGMNDWSDDQLRQAALSPAMTKPSVRRPAQVIDPRQQQAAMTLALGKGLLDLGQANQRAAFENVTRNPRMPESDRRKLRLDNLRQYAATTDNVDELKRQLPNLQFPEEQAAYAEAIDRKKGFVAGNTGDEGIINNVRDALGGLPGRLKEFDDALERSNPDMALRTIYHGLGDARIPGANVVDDVQRYLAHVQQGLITSRVLTPEVQAQVSNRLRQFGLAAEDASSYIARRMVHGARTKDDLERNISSMTDESAAAMLDGARLDYRDETGRLQTLDPDKQKVLADRYYYDEAFTRLDAATGQHETDLAAADQYATSNVNQVRAGYDQRRLSNSTVANRQLMERLDDMEFVTDDQIQELTLDARKRSLYGRHKIQQVDELKAIGANFGADNAPGRLNRKRLRFEAIAGRGGNLETGQRDPETQRPIEVNSLDSAYGEGNITEQARAHNPNIVTQIQEALEQYIRTQGDTLTRLDFNGLGTVNPQIQQTIVNNINVRDLTAMHNLNTQSVIDIIAAMRRRQSVLAPGSPERLRLDTILDQRLRMNDTLSGYI